MIISRDRSLISREELTSLAGMLIIECILLLLLLLLLLVVVAVLS